MIQVSSAIEAPDFTADPDFAAGSGFSADPVRPGSLGWRRPTWNWRILVAIWAVVSIVWMVGVAYSIYQRASTQADMSRDVEHDLDLVSCTGPKCSVSFDNDSPTQSKFDIVSTYFRFGSADMAEFTIGPPLLLLIAVVGGIVLLRRREAHSMRPEICETTGKDCAKNNLATASEPDLV